MEFKTFQICYDSIAFESILYIIDNIFQKNYFVEIKKLNNKNKNEVIIFLFYKTTVCFEVTK